MSVMGHVADIWKRRAAESVAADPRFILPVISMWMPWANWVALGWKPIETRTHVRFRSLLGKRIGIHATLKFDMTALYAALPYLSDTQLSASDQFLKIGGAIICTAFVKEFRELTAEDSQFALIDCGTTKRFGLVLDDIQTIEAIPARGKQGIWYHDFGNRLEETR